MGYTVTNTFHPKFCQSGLTETKPVCAATPEEHTNLLTAAVRRLQRSREIPRVRAHVPPAIPEPEPTDARRGNGSAPLTLPQHCS